MHVDDTPFVLHTRTVELIFISVVFVLVSANTKFQVCSESLIWHLTGLIYHVYIKTGLSNLHGRSACCDLPARVNVEVHCARRYRTTGHRAGGESFMGNRWPRGQPSNKEAEGKRGRERERESEGKK